MVYGVSSGVGIIENSSPVSTIEDVRFWPKVGQIGTKWDKSGTFSDKISVHFGSANHKLVQTHLNGTNPGLFQIRFQCIWRPAPNALKSDLKKPRICPI